MPLLFHRAVENLEIWSATSDGYSFVISYESPTGPGFHGRAGYMASWRPAYEGRGAIRITGSPFKTFDEAGAACDAMLNHLALREAIYAAARSCLSAPRITIFITSSDNGPCNVFASSHGARIHASRSSSGG